MRIKDLPKDIQEVVLLRSSAEFSKDEVMDTTLSHAFNWEETEEKYYIWQQVNRGNFKPFYDYYGIPYPMEDEGFKGNLKGFPKEVVERMLDEQVRQGNKRDVTVFEKCYRASKNNRGFSWDDSIEKYDFWDNVIVLKDFDLFFEKYPKKTDESFRKICNGIADLLKEKNKRYGNSALEPLNIFSGKCKTGQRMDDKLSRIKNSDDLRKNDLVDLIGYCILTCKEKGWEEFSDLID